MRRDDGELAHFVGTQIRRHSDYGTQPGFPVTAGAFIR